MLYGKLGRHDDAIRHGLKVCELEPKDPFSFTAMSVTFQRADGASSPCENTPKLELVALGELAPSSIDTSTGTVPGGPENTRLVVVTERSVLNESSS